MNESIEEKNTLSPEDNSETNPLNAKILKEIKSLRMLQDRGSFGGKEIEQILTKEEYDQLMEIDDIDRNVQTPEQKEKSQELFKKILASHKESKRVHVEKLEKKIEELKSQLQ